jgi:hypothetical protein
MIQTARLPLPSLLLAGLLVSCSDSHAGTAPQAEETGAAEAAADRATASRIADAPLEDFRGRLLDLAFDAASALPVEPHLKTRSRSQEEVVTACFELDLPRRALRYAEDIASWRRGAAYADFAYHCAERGETAEVDRYLELALRVAETDELARKQSWRRDRVRAKVARVHLLLGRDGEAARIEQGLEPSEVGTIVSARARRVEPEAFDARLEELERILPAGSFDQVQAALWACAELFERFYGDEPRRSRVEGLIREYGSRMPRQAYIELLASLSERAMALEDSAKALELIDLARAALEEASWAPEDRLPLACRLTGLRFRAGDAEGARRGADEALASYDREREQIQSGWRAGALRPVAEAYHALGDEETALTVYRRTLEEGAVNPNARPRAVDLAATCRSMAAAGLEPDARTWKRMAEIRAGLTDPW